MGAPPKWATLDDLMRHEGRAELIGGRVVELMPTGDEHVEIAGNIYRHLWEYARRTGRGRPRTDGLGYAVPMLRSGRESFQPDASFYVQPRPADRSDFVEGPPLFAAEVRSKSDRGPAAEAEMAAKREDYFEAGTEVVWDINPLTEEVHRYCRGEATPAVFRRGDLADAEPALPGWTMSVEDVFHEL
ncbi:MAG: Uma2 family endonuclease [Gemmataceae bacterium]